jgi:hypothetical protein
MISNNFLGAVLTLKARILFKTPGTITVLPFCMASTQNVQQPLPWQVL